MASALLRVVRLGTQIWWSQATSLVRTSNVTRILESTVRTCTVGPKLQRTNDVLRQQVPNTLEKDVVSTDNISDKVESLLKPVSVAQLSGVKAAEILLALGKLAASDDHSTAAIVNNSKFVVLCSVIDENVTSLTASTLMAILRTLIGFGVSADDPIIESVETQILWKIRSMSLKHLMTLFVFFVDHQLRKNNNKSSKLELKFSAHRFVFALWILQKTELQKRVLTEVMARLQQRWFEISDPRDVVTLLRHASKFRNDFIQKLEDRVIDLVENGMSADNLHRVFVTFAEQRMRATHVLRSITYHLRKHQEKLSFKQMANLTNAMSTLSYTDETLLRRISDELLTDLPSAESPTVVAAILTAFGRIQWRHPTLMMAFSDWLLKNISRCRVADLVAYLLTSARVRCGLSTAAMEAEPTSAILEAVLPHVTRESVNSDVVWLNVVWSLAILGQANLNQIQPILHNSFYQILINSPGYHSITSRRKICNLHSIAKWELGYKETLPPDLASDQNQVQIAKSDDELRKSILDTLSNYVPKGKFLSCSTWTPSGIFVDAEFVLDKEGKPLPLEDYSTNFGEVESRKALPLGAHRFALLVQDFKDFTLNSVALTGLASLSVRILENAGYKVVQVPYSNYNVKAPTLKRLQYLQLTINNTRGVASKNSKP